MFIVANGAVEVVGGPNDEKIFVTLHKGNMINKGWSVLFFLSFVIKRLKLYENLSLDKFKNIISLIYLKEHALER